MPREYLGSFHLIVLHDSPYVKRWAAHVRATEWLERSRREPACVCGLSLLVALRRYGAAGHELIPIPFQFRFGLVIGSAPEGCRPGVLVLAMVAASLVSDSATPTTRPGEHIAPRRYVAGAGSYGCPEYHDVNAIVEY